MAVEVCAFVGNAIGGVWPLDFDVVIEVPQVYELRKEDPNDLIDVAGVVGAILGKFSTVGGKAAWTPKPREWKGNAPKRITKLRVNEKLSSEELKLIPRLAESRLHNVLDAVHLGLVHMSREGRRL